MTFLQTAELPALQKIWVVKYKTRQNPRMKFNVKNISKIFIQYFGCEREVPRY